MKLLSLKPAVHFYETCKEFREEAVFTENTLIITNRYIFEPFFFHL